MSHHGITVVLPIANECASLERNALVKDLMHGHTGATNKLKHPDFAIMVSLQSAVVTFIVINTTIHHYLLPVRHSSTCTNP